MLLAVVLLMWRPGARGRVRVLSPRPSCLPGLPGLGVVPSPSARSPARPALLVVGVVLDDDPPPGGAVVVVVTAALLMAGVFLPLPVLLFSWSAGLLLGLPAVIISLVTALPAVVPLSAVGAPVAAVPPSLGAAGFLPGGAGY